MIHLPIGRGAGGPAVRDLQQRLTVVGFSTAPDPPDRFELGTEGALQLFQARRGLDVTGVCDAPTWAALVEAGFRLGDRLLYLHNPMLRGDDIHLVQLELSALGFHRGRVDGIFGPETRDAVAEFQRNVALAPDGVVGPDTIAALRRLRPRPGTSVPVAVVLEQQERHRTPRDLSGLRVVLGDPGTAPSLLASVARRVRVLGGIVLTMSHPDGSVLAATANRFGAHVFLGLELVPEPDIVARYFATDGFESATGRELASRLSSHLDETVDGSATSVHGMRLPVLRETRMPAVTVRLGPASTVLAQSRPVVEAVVAALVDWLTIRGDIRQ